MSPATAPIHVSCLPISCLDDARAALAAGLREGHPVTLIGDGATGGAGWFSALIEIVRQEYPEAALTAVLHCHDQPGLVLAGVRAGCTDLLFSGPPELAARLAALAATAGALLHRPDATTGFPAPHKNADAAPATG